MCLPVHHGRFVSFGHHEIDFSQPKNANIPLLLLPLNLPLRDDGQVAMHPYIIITISIILELECHCKPLQPTLSNTLTTLPPLTPTCPLWPIDFSRDQ